MRLLIRLLALVENTFEIKITERGSVIEFGISSHCNGIFKFFFHPFAYSSHQKQLKPSCYFHMVLKTSPRWTPWQCHAWHTALRIADTSDLIFFLVVEKSGERYVSRYLSIVHNYWWILDRNDTLTWKWTNRKFGFQEFPHGKRNYRNRHDSEVYART